METAKHRYENEGIPIESYYTQTGQNSPCLVGCERPKIEVSSGVKDTGAEGD